MLVLAAVLLLVWRWRQGQSDQTAAQPASEAAEAAPPARSAKAHDAGFDRTAPLEFTAHARCRMACRQVTAAEIREIMARGRIDLSRSDLQDKPCPTYALEGYSQEGQHLRVVFAPCGEVTRVVTCIDLDKAWKCNCN
ncbi:hypothetical protein GCM10009415_41850 [Chitinophaga japonensis]